MTPTVQPVPFKVIFERTLLQKIDTFFEYNLLVTLITGKTTNRNETSWYKLMLKLF